MPATQLRRFALATLGSALLIGASACGDGSDETPAREPKVADTDLAAASWCGREDGSFVLNATVINDDDDAASYTVTATVQSAEDRRYRATGTAQKATVPSGETAEVNLSGFGVDAPRDATCTITAIKTPVD